MAQDDLGGGARLPADLEFQIRKYEARMSVLKIGLGTALVGVISVLVPGAVEFWDLRFQTWREQEQLAFQREVAREGSIQNFVELALNEDIEYRLRLAEYFSVVAHETDKPLWEGYYNDLKTRRRDTKAQILKLESQLNQIAYKPEMERTPEETIAMSTLKLELDWLYGELGRTIRGESVVPTASEQRTNTSATPTAPPTGSIARDADLSKLHPDLRDKLTELVSRLNAEGIPFQVFEGYRSPDRQAHLYAQGRTSPGNKVVWIQPWGSMHNYGLAANLVLYEDGKWSWANTGSKADWWDRMNELAIETGLTPIYASGRVIEPGHIQLPDLKITDLQRGVFPDGGDQSWQDNLRQAIEGWTGNGAPPTAGLPSAAAFSFGKN